jgi:hypothetical protein
MARPDHRVARGLSPAPAPQRERRSGGVVLLLLVIGILLLLLLVATIGIVNARSRSTGLCDLTGGATAQAFRGRAFRPASG